MVLGGLAPRTTSSQRSNICGTVTPHLPPASQPRHVRRTKASLSLDPVRRGSPRLLLRQLRLRLHYDQRRRVQHLFFVHASQLFARTHRHGSVQLADRPLVQPASPLRTVRRLPRVLSPSWQRYTTSSSLVAPPAAPPTPSAASRTHKHSLRDNFRVSRRCYWAGPIGRRAFHCWSWCRCNNIRGSQRRTEVSLSHGLYVPALLLTSPKSSLPSAQRALSTLLALVFSCLLTYIAGVLCRKQKMKCEGPDRAPCKRCRTAGVECAFETPPPTTTPRVRSGAASEAYVES